VITKAFRTMANFAVLTLLASCTLSVSETEVAPDSLADVPLSSTQPITDQTGPEVLEYYVNSHLLENQVTVSPKGDRAIILDSLTGSSGTDNPGVLFDTVTVLEIGGAGRSQTFNLQGDSFSKPEITQDGKLAFLKGRNPVEIHVLDLENMIQLKTLVTRLSDFSYLEMAVMSPNGTHMMGYIPKQKAQSQDYLFTPALRSFDPSGPEFLLSELSASSLKFTEKNDRILIAGTNLNTGASGLYSASISESTDGEFINLDPNRNRYLIKVAASSPSGRFVFLESSILGSSLPVYNLVDVEKRVVREVSVSDYFLDIVAFSPDETLAVSRIGEVFRLETGEYGTWKSAANWQQVLQFQQPAMSLLQNVYSTSEQSESGNGFHTKIELFEIDWENQDLGRKLPVSNFQSSGSVVGISVSTSNDLIVVDIQSEAGSAPEIGQPANIKITTIDTANFFEGGGSSLPARWFGQDSDGERVFTLRTDPLVLEVWSGQTLGLIRSTNLSGLLRRDQGNLVALSEVMTSPIVPNSNLLVSKAGDTIFLPVNEMTWDEKESLNSYVTTIYAIDLSDGYARAAVEFDHKILSIAETETDSGIYMVLSPNDLPDSAKFLARWQPGQSEVEYLADLREWESEAFSFVTWIGEHPEPGTIWTRVGYDLIHGRDAATGKPISNLWIENFETLLTVSRVISSEYNSTLGIHVGPNESAVTFRSLEGNAGTSPPGELIATWDSPQRPVAATSADGSSYMVVRGAEISEWAADSGELLRVGNLAEAAPAGLDFYSLAISPLGEQILLLAAMNENLEGSVLVKAQIGEDVWQSPGVEIEGQANTDSSNSENSQSNTAQAFTLTTGLVVSLALLVIVASILVFRWRRRSS